MTPVVEDAIVAGRPAGSGGTHEVRSPYDGTVVGSTRLASVDEIDRAIVAAERARSEVAELPSHARARICLTVADRIREEADDLAVLIAAEAGKPLRAAAVEVARAATCFETAAGEALRRGGEVLSLDTIAGTEGRWGIVRRFPAGVVLAITPFNFPINLVAHKLAPAVAAGTPVILKPAPQAPLTGLRLLRFLVEAGWPPAAASGFLVDPQHHDLLVRDERIAVLSFTGSAAVGWHLKAAAGRKKTLLELGGNAAVIVDEGVDLSCVAMRLAEGGFGYAGQACISVQRLVVQRAVLAELADLLVERTRALVVGDPLDPSTDVGPMIDETAATRAATWTREAEDAGARVAVGGDRDGALLEPTVLLDAPAGTKVWDEEVFAPIVVASRGVDDFDEAIDVVNRSRYGLQAGVYTNDITKALRAYEHLEVGGVIINDIPTWRHDAMPYGGVKDSGAGREGIRYSIDELTEPRLLVLGAKVGA